MLRSRVQLVTFLKLYVKININSVTLHILSVYRPPCKNKLLFIEELSKLLREIPSSNDLIFIGDINIDLYENKINSATTLYKNMVCEHGLQLAIPCSEITREAVVNSVNQRSCIDHACVRVRQFTNYASFIIECHLSDHHMIGIGISLQVMQNDDMDLFTNSTVTSSIIIINKLVKGKLDKIEWSALLLFSCPLLLYSNLSDIFYTIYKESEIVVPLKRKRPTQPWVCNKLYNMIEHRDNLFRAWKLNPNMCTRLE